MVIFHSYVNLYQRVNLHFPLVFLWCSQFSIGKPMVFPRFSIGETARQSGTFGNSWIVYMGKSYSNGWELGVAPWLGKPPFLHRPCCYLIQLWSCKLSKQNYRNKCEPMQTLKKVLQFGFMWRFLKSRSDYLYIILKAMAAMVTFPLPGDFHDLPLYSIIFYIKPYEAPEWSC